MKILNSLILITTLYKLQCNAASSGIVSNLAFYGRGQRIPSIYWNDMKKIRGSKDAKVFFPYNESDGLNGNNSKREENAANEADLIVDTARNYPLVLLLPGKKDKDYSSIIFNVVNDENTEIDLTDFHKVKSEMKLVHPTAEDLISEGYTCEKIGLDCTDLKQYDFEAKRDEWLSKVDVQLYLRSDNCIIESLDDEDLSEDFVLDFCSYRIESNKGPTDEWSEVIGDIDDTMVKDPTSTYNDFIFKNYGSMPVYIFIGNTVFLKKAPTEMVKNGVILNGFDNWSWHKDGNSRSITYFDDQVYEKDPERKKCAKLEVDVPGDAGFYVHFGKGISAPPEGLSFVIRSLYDNKFKFKIENKKEIELDDYLEHRHCALPIGEEIEYLVDLRSLVYSDPKFLLMNDVGGFWFMSISEVDDIKAEIALRNATEAEEYKDVLYFYSFTLHNTYPEDLKKYKKYDIPGSSEKCNMKLETHEDWADPTKVNQKYPIIQWPDDIPFETIFKSKNYFIIEDESLFLEDEEEVEEPEPEETPTIENPDNNVNTNTTDNDPVDSSANLTIKPYITLCLIATVLAFFF